MITCIAPDLWFYLAIAFAVFGAVVGFILVRYANR